MSFDYTVEASANKIKKYTADDLRRCVHVWAVQMKGQNALKELSKLQPRTIISSILSIIYKPLRQRHGGRGGDF